MQLTKQQIEALKGKCPGCDNTGEQLGMAGKTKDSIFLAMQTCEVCLGNKKATIEIEKEPTEWMECQNCKGIDYIGIRVCYNCNNTRKIKIAPKFKVGDEIKIKFCRKDGHFAGEFVICNHNYSHSVRWETLKIISETEDKLIGVMV